MRSTKHTVKLLEVGPSANHEQSPMSAITVNCEKNFFSLILNQIELRKKCFNESIVISQRNF